MDQYQNNKKYRYFQVKNYLHKIEKKGKIKDDNFHGSKTKKKQNSINPMIALYKNCCFLNN